MSCASASNHLRHALVWGLGSGLHLRPLIAQFAQITVYPIDVDPAKAAVAFQEISKDSILLDALSKKKLEVVFAAANDQLRHFNALAQRLDSNKVHIVIHLPALIDVPPAAEPVAAVLERMHRERQRSARVQNRLRSNIAANLPAIAKAFSLDQLRNIALRQPALVFGGGPGLAHATSLLEAARGRAHLIAVDTALPVIRRLGLEPHFIASIDPHAQSQAHIDAVASPGAVGDLIFQPSTAPEVVARFGERRFVALPDHDRFAAMVHARLGVPILPAAGTVLVYAIQVAQILGADPIILVGADFAFVDRLSHAPGTAHVRAMEQTNFEIDTWSGERVASSLALRNFRDGCVQALAHSVGSIPTREVWTLDAGGARIGGATPMLASELGQRISNFSELCDVPHLQARSLAQSDERLQILTAILHELDRH